MSLANLVTTGRKIKPLAVFLYGVHGVGKSTFGQEAPAPIFVGSEENDELEVARMPIVKKWPELRSYLQMIMDDDSGTYKTVVIDTIDKLEEIAIAHILTGKNEGKTMATAMGGFGKAYEKMADMFRAIRDDYLIPMRDKKGMNIVILGHCEKSKFEDPMTATSYDTYSTSCHKKIKPIFEDWVSVILFATYERFKAENQDGKEYAEGEGRRIMYSEERPSHIAKNRFNLETEIEMEVGESWTNFSKQVRSFYQAGSIAKKFTPVIDPVKMVAPVDTRNTGEVAIDLHDEKYKESPAQESNDESSELKFQIDALMKDVDEDMREKLNLSITRAGSNVKKLTQTKKKIEAMLR